MVEECKKEKPTGKELTEFALKIVAAMRGQAAGVIETPQLKDWTKEELEGTANLLLEDLREGRTTELEALYLGTCGEPFRREITRFGLGEERERALRREGEAIAKELANGVTYRGPWLPDGPEGEFFGHFFSDDAVTETSFVAFDLEDAKQRLIDLREKFGAEPPVFKGE